MSDSGRRVCPLCGNDRLISVTTEILSQPKSERFYCAGSLGCHAWWSADETQPPTPRRPRPRPVSEEGFAGRRRRRSGGM